MLQSVVLAPVPCVLLESAMTVPSLGERVAFGTSQPGVPDLPVGLPVFIYASMGPHGLFRLGQVSWTGTLGAIVPAAKGGARDGKHPDPAVRPPHAEANDKAFLFFWEVLGLHPLSPTRPLHDFKSAVTLGEAPKWPAVAELDF